MNRERASAVLNFTHRTPARGRFAANSQQMRILYDHQAFSLQSYGGITRVFSEIIRYLNTQPGLATDVLLGFSGNKADFESLVSPPGRVIRPGGALFSSRPLNYAVNELVSAAASLSLGRYDVYHSTYYRFMPFIRAARRVATHHDCVPEMFPKLFPDSGALIRLKRALFSKADLILCVSAASRADLLRFYDVAEEKCVVVHNGVTIMTRQPSGADELTRIVDGEFILHVGVRHSYKNFDGLLRGYSASGISRTHQLLVLGGGPASKEDRDLVDRLGLSVRIVFVPFSSAALLAEAYAKAALLVYPSLYEGFGLPPLEAAALGCVSLVASNPATVEVCEDAVFFFDPSSADDLARMLPIALNDSAGRVARLQRARNLVTRYSWAACGSKTLDAYRRLL